MLTDTERGYIAGFIDGEGCIAITKRMARGGKNYSYRLEVIIAQAPRGGTVLTWLQSRIGGVIHTLKNENLTLRLAAQDSARLAAWITTYSVIKQDQWRTVHAFLMTFEGETRGRGGLKSEVVTERDALYSALMDMHGGTKVRRRAAW